MIKTASIKNKSHIKGFTLIEMMIVVAIIGILAAIAYPSYQNYVIKTKRTDMMSELQNIAGRIKAQKLANGSYSGVSLSDIYSNTVSTAGTTTFPNSGTALYTVSIDKMNSGKTKLSSGDWTLIATPLASGPMAGDGNLKLKFNGEKCHKTKCSFDDGWR